MFYTENMFHRVSMKLLKIKGLTKEEAEDVLMIEVYGLTPNEKADVLYQARNKNISIESALNSKFLSKQRAYYSKLLENYYDNLCETYRTTLVKQFLKDYAEVSEA